MNDFQIFAIVLTGAGAAYSATQWADKEMLTEERRRARGLFFFNAAAFVFNVTFALSWFK